MTFHRKEFSNKTLKSINCLVKKKISLNPSEVKLPFINDTKRKWKDDMQSGKRYWQHNIDTGIVSNYSNDFRKSTKDRNNPEESRQGRHFL